MYCTCIVMHEICMVSYPQLASLATYEFDSAIFRLNLGLLYNVVFISEQGVSEFWFFFFFFFFCACRRWVFLKLRRATHVFYTGEITGLGMSILGIHFEYISCCYVRQAFRLSGTTFVKMVCIKWANLSIENDYLPIAMWCFIMKLEFYIYVICNFDCVKLM